MLLSDEAKLHPMPSHLSIAGFFVIAWIWATIKPVVPASALGKIDSDIEWLMREAFFGLEPIFLGDNVVRSNLG
jgi:hypothetical protein